jgi:ATP-dependent DNA ligase
VRFDSRAPADYLGLMLLRTRRTPSGFIQPCLPSPAERPPIGPGWIHEIKHDGFRTMVRGDAAGVRLLTRNGVDWSARFPLILEAAGALQVRSFLLDGEAVACDGDGLPVFDRLRYRRQDGRVFLYAFDLGEDWWADVLADPRARKRKRRTDQAVKQVFYRLADEPRETILVACSKCDWRAAFSRDELIASHGADYAMPNLLDHLAAPSCNRLGSNWDRCGVHYVEPIEGAR